MEFPHNIAPPTIAAILQNGMSPWHLSTIMHTVAPSESKIKVFSPAVCPLVERSLPTKKANNIASTNRNNIDQTVTSDDHAPSNFAIGST